ncbi:MAG: mobile mystery protein A [Gammaproteobacteria bacterium]|nr:MAG: mobile mystery protein A [Gammaproteobacteria bacterium]
MRNTDRASARRQLDKRLNLLRDSYAITRPPRGWIKAIREALGMTTAQLARRIGVSQPRVVAIEKAEKNASITLGSLERAARALDCQVVYALIPRKPLNDLVEERVRIVAEKRLQSTQHSMALEAQSIDKSDEEEQLKRLSERLMKKAGSELWEDSV